METLKIKLKKYTYTLERVPRISEEIGGCYGCFFCKLRDGYYRQTCGDYKKIIGNCEGTMLKMIKKDGK